EDKREGACISAFCRRPSPGPARASIDSGPSSENITPSRRALPPAEQDEWGPEEWVTFLPDQIDLGLAQGRRRAPARDQVGIKSVHQASGLLIIHCPQRHQQRRGSG